MITQMNGGYEMRGLEMFDRRGEEGPLSFLEEALRYGGP